MVKAKMVYTLEDMKAFSRSSACTGTFRLPIIVITALAAVFSVYLLFTDMGNGWLLYSMLIMIVGVLIYTYLFINIPEKNFRRAAALQGNIPEFITFDDEKISCSFSSADRCYNQMIKYSGIVQCIETEKYFYFRENRYRTMILRKDSITEGTSGELSEICRKNLGDKFVVKTYNR